MFGIVDESKELEYDLCVECEDENIAAQYTEYRASIAIDLGLRDLNG